VEACNSFIGYNFATRGIKVNTLKPYHFAEKKNSSGVGTASGLSSELIFFLSTPVGRNVFLGQQLYQPLLSAKAADFYNQIVPSYFGFEFTSY
jgi:hypothetical protein